jgi:hypothetical protein
VLHEKLNAEGLKTRPQRRRSERITFNKHVLVYTSKHPEGLFATIVNWSSEGACLLFSADIKMPKRFFFRSLKNFSMGNATHCERIWQTGHEVGVAFFKRDADPAG